jgi:hypothetical protein
LLADACSATDVAAAQHPRFLVGIGLPLLLSRSPFLPHQVGLESFGILTLVWALIGYFGCSISGSAGH